MNQSKIFTFFISPLSLVLIWIIGFNSQEFNLIILNIGNYFDYPEEYLSKFLNFISEDIEMMMSENNLYYFSFFVIINIFLIYNFCESTKNYSFFYLLTAIILIPLQNEFVDAIWIRRFIFFIIFIPCFSKLFIFFCKNINLISSKFFNKILKVLFIMFFVILIFPGFYLPPFFDGISGWYQEQNPKTYSISAIKIKFNDQSKVWFRQSFFNPLTAEGRPIEAIKKRDSKFYKNDMSNFLMSLYKKNYPNLQKKRASTERILGKFSYLPHNIDLFDEREKYLAPNLIIAFEEVEINFDGNERTESIKMTWNINNE